VARGGRLAERLGALGLGDAQVAVRRVDAIPRQSTGKLKRFVRVP
jgi:hypothetical protein